ncbi:MAG: hypothetical protein LBQ90_07560 [Synergistaceae bacterium]|jgi:hypothetical protein|nr:hypothetical protein [Synergistaceae bacterium]
MRLFILTLSMGCVILYGYALAGYAGYSFGRGRPDYIVWGLSLGTLCGGVALYLWRRWMPLFYIDPEESPDIAKAEMKAEMKAGMKDEEHDAIDDGSSDL